MSRDGDWAGTYPDPEGRICEECHNMLSIDCAGLVCDWCWRLADAEYGGDGDEQ